MYGAKYAENLRRNFLSATDEQGSDNFLVRKADLKVYEDTQDV